MKQVNYDELKYVTIPYNETIDLKKMKHLQYGKRWYRETGIYIIQTKAKTLKN